jgi:paraquat-inducible protein B
MKRKASATLIGGFVVFGIALLAAAIVAVAGNKLFIHKERAVMHFSGSVYGLQVGAPVVFRGVRVGSVTSIDVFYERASDSFSIPVVVELEGDAVSGLDGKRADVDVALALPALVQRGLNAQLQMQSLLTGLLYVDLDLRPNARATVRGTYRDLVEIPTTATAIQALKTQLEGMDFRRMAEDLSAIAASARAVVAGPEIKQALGDLARITASVKHLSERLDKRVDPLADDIQKTLATARSAAQDMGRAARSVDSSAGRVGTAGDRAAAALAPDSALLQSLQRAAAEVARSAQQLSQATAGDSGLVRGGEQALQDLSRAARALRDLAEALEQKPESLLRGREVAK